MKATLVLLLVVVVAVCAQDRDYDQYTFENYIAEFEKHYTLEQYEVRRAIFNKKIAAIRAHNRDTSKTWKEGVNKYTDATEAEFKALRGYNPSARPTAEKRSFYSAVHQPVSYHTAALPTSVDWRNEGVVTPVKDQASCGSCWSFATAETLESQWAIKTKQLVVLSEQQVLDCTPNPQNCGGSGGCQGGTAELAYARIAELGGLTTEALYPYVSGRGSDYKCKNPIPAPVAKITNYTKLPENEYDPLMTAVATIGPIAISVDAASWGAYSSGVFNGCNQKNPDIDHAVVLVGYGTDAKLGDYWLVRNSWGASWGEKGYIRLHRNSTIECGIDLHPSDGSGCNGGPATVKVCGTCGILYDTCYPIVA
jgi:cathepsin L